MCNLYSMTTTKEAMLGHFRVPHNRAMAVSLPSARPHGVKNSVTSRFRNQFLAQRVSRATQLQQGSAMILAAVRQKTSMSDRVSPYQAAQRALKISSVMGEGLFSHVVRAEFPDLTPTTIKAAFRIYVSLPALTDA